MNIVILVCTPSNCCSSSTTPIWNEEWAQLLHEQAAHWSKLGWNQVLWDESRYNASAMAICYNNLTSVQLQAVKSLCYDQEKWDYDMLKNFSLYCRE